MSPEKEAFIKEIMSQSVNKGKQDMFPFIFAMLSKAKANKLQFSNEEAMLLFSQFKGRLSDKEQKQLMQVFQFIQAKNQEK